MSPTERPLSPRQEALLLRVVEAYIEAGAPVGSRTLVESGAVVASASTVRHELSELEALGMLGHPHTSAGRVPTTAGYRYYTSLVERRGVEPVRPAVDLSGARGELDSALRLTAEALAQATDLLAAVSAPSLDTTVVRHVELVPLQPQLVMAIVITASGGVAKRLFVFDDAVDPGLLEWTRDYVNESIVGLRLGARTLRQRLSDPSLGTAERGILERLEPVFTELVDEGSLYLGGAAGLLADLRASELDSLREVVSALEERLQLLAALRDVLDTDRNWIRVGDDTIAPALRSLSLVAANYGIAGRNLGTVALIGPQRMDYVAAMRAVRGAAMTLSEFVEEIYD
jgi:heat-inducible transcriptional repressor